jgi:hypothetical protein
VPNKAGRYYFDQLQREPPDHGFDASVQPVREGRREFALMKNGRRVTLRTFNGRTWSFTGFGRDFYKTARKTYIVQLPITNVFSHPGGRLSYGHGEYLPSTATTLGAISLPYVFENPERELRRRVDEWIATLQRDHQGFYVIGEDYYLERRLDEDRLGDMKFDEEGVRTADGEVAVRATLERPLLGRPLCYVGTESASPEAFRETAMCVATQFWKLAARDGKPVFDSLEATMDAFDEAHRALYHTAPPPGPCTHGDKYFSQQRLLRGVLLFGVPLQKGGERGLRLAGGGHHKLHG